MDKKKNLKKQYESLQKRCSEMEEDLQYLIEKEKNLSIEWKYLNDFIHYKKLEEDYRYFCENAKLEEESEFPFPYLTL